MAPTFLSFARLFVLLALAACASGSPVDHAFSFHALNIDAGAGDKVSTLGVETATQIRVVDEVRP